MYEPHGNTTPLLGNQDVYCGNLRKKSFTTETHTLLKR